MKLIEIYLSLFLFLASFNTYISADDKMFEDYINTSLNFWSVPGAAVVIVKDNNIVMSKGFGYTKLDKIESNKVDAKTMFPIASLTKSFSAVAAGIFAEQQQKNVDVTIKSLWPEFKMPDDFVTNHLTLRDCLSMRAGLAGAPFDDHWWSQSHLTEQQLLDALSQLSFPCGFRGCFAYQNLLLNVLDPIFKKNSGKSWESFIKENILDTLDMPMTTTNQPSFLAIQNKAYPHKWKDKDVSEVPFERVDVIGPGAGLSSNADDMAKWLKYLLNKNSSHSTLIQETLTSQTVVQPENFFAKEEVWMEKIFFPDRHFLTYGMGWFIHDYKNIVVCQDPGMLEGINGLMAVIPELDLGIVILSNLEAPFFSHSVLFHVIDHYRKENTDWDPILRNIQKAH